MSQRVELLAPAGNAKGFYGAIHAGADAVYLAGSRFGARAYADNFTTEELVACIRYAHIWGRKVYLTVNTLIKENEFEDLAPYLTPFYEAGLDGVIVQDIGVFSFIREHFPGLELHVSTQMTLTGEYGASLLKEMGAVRIVPARELSLEELTHIKKQTGLEIEAFIHGAMCYCYSGQCLFSSILGGRSGNRGRCAQPCRLPYKVNDSNKTGKECYPLSLKDMCTIDHIPELIEAGIDSFKIEGRMKRPEYAAGVTAIYRKYIDKFYAGEDCQVSPKDMESLSRLYIRSERQDGYLHRHNGKDMVTMSNPSYSGTDELLLEAIEGQYLSKRPFINLTIKAFFRVGRNAKVIFSCTDKPSLNVRVEGDIVLAAVKQPISEENIHKQLTKLGETVFQSDSISIEVDENAFYPLKAINELRRHAISLLENAIIQEHGLCVSRQIPDEAASMEQLSVLPKSPHGEERTSNGFRALNAHISVSTAEQLDALCDLMEGPNFSASPSLVEAKTGSFSFFPDRVYIESDCIYEAIRTSDSHLFNQCENLLQKGCHPVIALSPILRRRDDEFLDCIWNFFQDEKNLFTGFLVRSMEGLGFLSRKAYGMKEDEHIYTDAGFYIWNKQSIACLTGPREAEPVVRLSGFCLPYELKAVEQRQLLKNLDINNLALQNRLSVEKVIYGRIPLMLTANCIFNTTKGCERNSQTKVSYLMDRYNKSFPVYRNCIHCVNTIYNSLPLSLHQEYSKWTEVVDFRLNFTIEDGQETRRILQYFLSGARGQTPYGEYTTGHEKRGVE